MKDPKQFNKVSALTYCFIAVLNAVFATLAFMFFGNDTGNNNLNNLILTL